MASCGPDERRLDEAGRRIAVDWLRLARARARAFAGRSGLDGRDLFSAAYLGLCMAALTYRRTEVPFGAWARIRIDLALRRELAFLRRHPMPLADELTVADPSSLDAEGWPDWLERAWGEMPVDRRELVERRLAGDTLGEIGADLGLTPSGVRAAYLREIERLRARAAEAMPDGR